MNDLYNLTLINKNVLLRFAGAAIGTMALVWWCIFYPELCFPRDTYKAVYETQADSNSETENSDSEILAAELEDSGTEPDILQADDEQIVVKSRLLEWLKSK